MLAAIDDTFGDQAIETLHARAIDELIAPHFDAVLTATDPPGRHSALDALIAAWNQLAPGIKRLS